MGVRPRFGNEFKLTMYNKPLSVDIDFRILGCKWEEIPDNVAATYVAHLVWPQNSEITWSFSHEERGQLPPIPSERAKVLGEILPRRESCGRATTLLIRRRTMNSDMALQVHSPRKIITLQGDAQGLDYFYFCLHVSV